MVERTTRSTVVLLHLCVKVASAHPRVERFERVLSGLLDIAFWMGGAAWSVPMISTAVEIKAWVVRTPEVDEVGRCAA